MRRTFLAVAALAACISWASSVSAGTWYRKIIRPGVKTYVGTAPDGFQIGTLFGAGWVGAGSPAESFTYNSDNAALDSLGREWRWGRAHGTAGKCGWVLAADLMLDGYTSYDCSSALYSTAGNIPARQFLRTYYACAVNDYVPAVPGGGSGPYNVSPFYIHSGVGSGNYSILTYSTEGVFANYDFNYYQFAGPMVDVLWRPDIYPEAQYPESQYHKICAWRWVSDNSACVLVKVRYGYWGFIPRNALPAQLLYADGNYRYDWQAGG